MVRVVLVFTCLLGIFFQACGGGGSSTPPSPPPIVASHFSVVAPATSSSGLGFEITVTAVSASNTTVTNYGGTVHFTSSDPRAVLPADSVLTNGTGSFPVSLFTPSTQTITSTDAGVATLTGVSNSITVNLAQVTSIPMTAAREFHTATLLDDGKVLVAGGNDGSTILSTAEVFDPSTGNFAAKGSLSIARKESTATLLGNGKVLIAGGLGANGQALTSAELYDPASGTFSLTDAMSIQRAEHTATLLNNGKVLIIGGLQALGSSQNTATSELFDPDTETFSATGSMTDARGNHVAALLKNGKVLVAGGNATDGSVLASAEIFDPVTGSFETTGNMGSPRESFTAAVLADGKVLITGGDLVTSTYSSAEIFDSSKGTFTITELMTIPRQWHTATTLSSGTVLVIGGDQLIPVFNGTTRSGFLPESTATNEFFDPGSKTFTAGNDLLQARARHRTTLLKDGSVLVTGGRRSRIVGKVPFSSVLSEAEVLN